MKPRRAPMTPSEAFANARGVVTHYRAEVRNNLRATRELGTALKKDDRKVIHRMAHKKGTVADQEAVASMEMWLNHTANIESWLPLAERALRQRDFGTLKRLGTIDRLPKACSRSTV